MNRHDARFAAWSLLLIGSAAAVLGVLMGSRATTTPRTEHRVTSSVPWRDRLDAVDAAIARRDPTAAVDAWREAYRLAVATRCWEAMAAVGDTAVRMQGLVGFPSTHPGGLRGEARQAYLSALFRARETGSPEGVLRVAEAFAALGDKEMAAQARAMAKERR
jgi:hypothetical protein